MDSTTAPFTTGPGLNYGIFNYSRHYGTGEHIALYNVMWYNGSGNKTGIYTFLGDDEYTNSRSTSSMYGTRTKIRAKYFPNVYGHHVQLTNSGSSSAARNLYGVYITIDGASKNGNAYGIYSRVGKFYERNGENVVANYAGYFAGDVVYSTPGVVTSDATVKENISDVRGAREILKKLKPKTYKYKKNNRFNNSTDRMAYGFLAQELEQILPDIVVDVYHPEITEPGDPEIPEEAGDISYTDETGQGNSTTNATSDSGRRGTKPVVVHKAETLKGIRYLESIPILTQALQEQDAELTELKKQTAANGKSFSADTTYNLEVRRLQQENEKLQVKLTAVMSRTDSLERYYVNKLTTLEQVNAEYQTYLSIVQADLKNLKDRMGALEECTDCNNGIGLHQATLSDKRVSVYPNPASGKVTVNNTISDNYLIRVLTADGREYARVHSENWIISIDVSDWPAGNYIFETHEGTIIIDQQMIAVQR